MYSMTVKFVYGRLQLSKIITGATREECMASINYTLDSNPALELLIIEEGSV